MLNLIEKYDFSEQNGLNVHRLVEAMKFGFSARYEHSYIHSFAH